MLDYKYAHVMMHADKGSEMLNQLKHFFRKRKDIEMAFLFGSEARGRTMSESDVDIAVWVSDGSDGKIVDSLWQELEILLHRNVDLIVLNTARPAIAWAAMRGMPLIIRNHEFFIQQMLKISDEAEFIQDFSLDLFHRRQKIREAA